MRELIWNENRVIAEPVEVNWFVEGRTDASFNQPPAYPENDRYWEGYTSALREVYLSRKNNKR